MIYVPPALNMVDFALTNYTVPDLAPYNTALTSYNLPALDEVNFSLITHTLPSWIGINFELGDAGGDATIIIVGVISYLGNGDEIILGEALTLEEGNQVASAIGSEAVLADGLIIEDGNSLVSASGEENVLSDSLKLPIGLSLVSGLGDELVLSDSLYLGEGLFLNLFTGNVQIEIEGDATVLFGGFLLITAIGDALVFGATADQVRYGPVRKPSYFGSFQNASVQIQGTGSNIGSGKI